MEFDTKFAIWLREQRDMCENEDFQEQIFTLIDNDLEIDLLNDEDIELILKLLKSNLKLSFILKNNKKPIDKLISYLE